MRQRKTSSPSLRKKANLLSPDVQNALRDPLLRLGAISRDPHCMDPQWTLVGAHSGLRIWHTKGRSPGGAIKSSVVIRAPCAMLSDLIFDIANARQFRVGLEGLHLVQRHTDNVSTLHATFCQAQTPWTWCRDVCFAQQRSRTDTSHFIAYGSWACEAAPKASPWKIVRAHLYAGGWVLTPSPSNPQHTLVSYLVDLDTSGWAPASWLQHVVDAEATCPAALANYVQYMTLSQVPDPLIVAAECAPLGQPQLAAPLFESTDDADTTANRRSRELDVLLQAQPTNAFVGAADSEDSNVSLSGGDSVGEGERPRATKQTSGDLFHEEADDDDDGQPLLDPNGEPYTLRSFPWSSIPWTQVMPRHSHWDQFEDKVAELLVAEQGGVEDGWTYVKVQDDVEVWKFDRSDAATFVKGSTILPTTGSLPLNLLRDITRKSMYDDMFDTGVQLEETTDFFGMVHQKFKPQWPTTARDIVHWAGVRPLEAHEGTGFVSVAASCEHPQCPPNPKFVRANLMLGGFVMRSLPEAPGSCRCTYVALIDLCGSLPAFVTKAVATGQPLILKTIRSLMTDLHGLDPEQQDEDDETGQAMMDLGMRWLRRQRQQQARKAAHTAASGKDASPAAGTQDTSPPSHSGHQSPASTQPAEDGNTTTPATTPLRSMRDVAWTPESSKVESKVAYHLPPQHADTIRTAIKRLILLASTRQKSGHGVAWKLESTKRNVAVMSCSVPGSPLLLWKGMAEVGAPPSVVRDTILDMRQTPEYDPLFRSGTVVERIDEFTDVRHVVFEGRRCLVKSCRDFVMLVHHRAMQDGSIMIVAFSVERPDIAVPSSGRRGEVMASGWIIKPKASNPSHSMACYITHIDVKGLPSTVINLVAKETPRVVGGLAEWIARRDSTPTV